jgi:hypothetical protein
VILALALAVAATPIDSRDAMERCAEAVIAARHPNMGMLDITATKFEWLSSASAGDGWIIIGSIIEPEGEARVARRFTCRTRGKKPPRIAFGRVIRL